MGYRWFLALVVVVAALWALALWTPGSSPSAHTAEEPEVAVRVPGPKALEASKVAPPSQLHAEPPEAPAMGPGRDDRKPAAPELPTMPPPPQQGPVGALKHRYETESLPQTRAPQELQLVAAFKGDDADLLDNVECRRTVCRVRLAWQPKHGFSGMRLMAELRRDFDPNLAIDQAGPSGASGAQAVDVYIDLTSSRPKVP